VLRWGLRWGLLHCWWRCNWIDRCRCLAGWGWQQGNGASNGRFTRVVGGSAACVWGTCCGGVGGRCRTQSSISIYLFVDSFRDS
jgi:hypothetical protein